MRAKMSCFMISWNLLKQGYPFVETIAQALPVCDEFLVLDGFSTDGTFKVLQQIAELNPKVRLYREEWRWDTSFAETLRIATNRLLEKCEGEFAFYIQANEVIHERSWDYLRYVPEMWPRTLSFSLPYTVLYHNLRLSDGHMLRLVKNIGIYEALTDAWTLGLKRSFIVKEFFKSLFLPRYFAQIVFRGLHGIYAHYRSSMGRYTLPLVLPRPIFRYSYVHPRDFLKKMRERVEVWKHDRSLSYLHAIIREAEEALKNSNEEVNQKILKAMRKNVWKPGFVPPDTVTVVELSEHPKIMQDLLTNYEEYVVRDEALRAIKEAR